MSQRKHVSQAVSAVNVSPTPGDTTLGNRSAPTQHEIARRAYELWEAAGRPEGDGLGDWFEAERQLAARSEFEAQPAADSEAVAGEPHHEHGPSRGGRPSPGHDLVAEQQREARENENARNASPTTRERMVDIGRGNQQSGRQRS
ncbi:MAG TPA: DUF2934 domain-containing protein [Isosphaeraceae bacterium]|nr:DUF2934 domain-containing protein [Isosphaeraceae bacterium]